MKIHERIHFYLIKHEENIFRNDYLQNHIYLLLSKEMYSRAERLLLIEIHYLREHLEDHKHAIKDLKTWKMGLGFIYLLMDKPELTGSLINDNKVLESPNSDKFIQLEDDFRMSEHCFKLQTCLDIFHNKDQEAWNNFFKSSKTYSIKPAILVQKLATMDISQQEKEQMKKEEEKKEIEDMIL